MSVGEQAPAMKQRLSRRRLIKTGLAAVAGAAGLGTAAAAARRLGLVPPDHAGLYGAGETLTYATQRLLMARQPLAREFDRRKISAVAPVNGAPPGGEDYQRLRTADFRDWRLRVDGAVDRPAAFSLADLRTQPARSQITHQACEEGWSFIAEWTGVPLAGVLDQVGARREARYVVFFAFDDMWDSLDMPDARHPQTLLAYAMNGETLPAPHGAPLRLRVARQLGYKSIKYLSHITVTESLDDIGDGRGSISPELGYSWYAGI
jgi:DMSO/TMAO reductase YedYZ molybdopterin-dependent catalytic subunit